MFRNRNNSQKPTDELYANFKATFSGVHGDTRVSEAAANQSSASLTDALDVAVTTRPYEEEHELKDMDPTPRGTTDQWRFTPSLLDPNSYAFTNFANQPPGYYTPTPGGTNTIYHNQAGDLHTPGFSLGLGTPLSMPTSDAPFHVAQAAQAPMHGYAPAGVAPHVFDNGNPYPFHHPAQSMQHHQQHIPPQTFAPHQFQQPQMQYDHFHHVMDTKDVSMMVSSMDMPAHTMAISGPAPTMEQALQQGAAIASAESFRYHVTLSAPTAMIKHPEEIPITYLNKGQAYSLTVIDTQPDEHVAQGAQYRTYVRISFEDEQQRQKPASCWQLWKEGRGTNEAHHRGGRLQAVEFVDPASAGTLDSASKANVELESVSFDGFAFTWTPVPGGSIECSIAVRFNFLSTDFSHSKGVKGIPVRLCAKTELQYPHSVRESGAGPAEVCFCKVKLFRDHGAERKLSNDVAHVKKSIDKLKQQIAQVEAGLKDPSKRKRNDSISKAPGSSKPGKVPKHKRTWSMSSDNSLTGLRRSTQEDDLQNKLQALQDMFSSTRPASVLFLKGEELDDPDLHPVLLSVITAGDGKFDGVEPPSLEPHTSNSTIISPTPSSISLTSASRRASDNRRTSFAPPSRMTSNEWQALSQTATADLRSQGQPITSSGEPTRIPAKSSGMDGWIDAVDVDRSYQPPERVIKPVACIYIRPNVAGVVPEDNFYRAVYLMQQTAKDLVHGIATKSHVEPSKVLQTIHVNKAKLEVLVDDGFVAEIPEGQDMVAEFCEIRRQTTAQQWHSAPEILVDGDIDSGSTVHTSGYLLRLFY